MGWVRRKIWYTRGVEGHDMFDCVMPTRNARNGWLFTRFGDIKIRNAVQAGYPAAGRNLRLDRQHFAWLSAPSAAGQRDLGARLNTIHNLYYYQQLMRDIRAAIDLNRYADGRAVP